MLWDRGETDGWAHARHDDPPPNTPPHTVLMHVAVGDHQVANAMSDVEARTIGARAYRPAFDAGRTFDKHAALRHPDDPQLPVQRLGDRVLGRRARRRRRRRR